MTTSNETATSDRIVHLFIDPFVFVFWIFSRAYGDEKACRILTLRRTSEIHNEENIHFASADNPAGVLPAFRAAAISFQRIFLRCSAKIRKSSISLSH